MKLNSLGCRGSGIQAFKGRSLMEYVYSLRFASPHNAIASLRFSHRCVLCRRPIASARLSSRIRISGEYLRRPPLAASKFP